jgi:hypothetical protein
MHQPPEGFLSGMLDKKAAICVTAQMAWARKGQWETA